MTPNFARYATPILLSLAVASGADAASASKNDKSSCFLFCDSKTAKAADAAKPDAAADLPGASIDLETAVAQAQAARKAGDLQGSAKILSQLVLFAPDDPHVLGEYGKTLTGLGRSDDALAFLDRAIQLMPMDWSLYSAQGVAYDQKSSYDAAQASYTRALALKPGEPTVLNNAALSRMQSGDLEGAKALLDQAMYATHDFPRIADNMAMVQRLMASRPAKVASAEKPQTAPQPATLPSSAVAPAATPAPAPAPAFEAARAPEPEIATEVIITPPAKRVVPVTAPSEPVQQTVTANETPAPSAPAVSEPAAQSSYASLKSDPTVVMAPIPNAETPKSTASPAPARVAALKPETKKREVIASAATAPTPIPSKPARAKNTGVYYVQAGAYATEERAGRQAEALDSLGARVSSATVGGHEIFRVRIGPFLDLDQANAAVSEAQAKGQGDVKIVADQ